MAGLLAGAAPAAAPLTFAELRWTEPGAELRALTVEPRACLTQVPANAIRVAAGRALFNSPALLGGQAAKAGLNCSSCHVNGRGNRHFLMTGVSDKPGTADVTNSFFGPARGNGRFDPVPIPDLAKPGKVPRESASGALEPFIRTLIVDEFSGAEPSTATLELLAAYVRAVGPCADDDVLQEQRLEGETELITGAVAGAAAMARQGDTRATNALIAAARAGLGRIERRYPGGAFRRERADLLAASRRLQALDVGSQGSDLALEQWRRDFARRLLPRLQRGESRSLYRARNFGFVALQREQR